MNVFVFLLCLNEQHFICSQVTIKLALSYFHLSNKIQSQKIYFFISPPQKLLAVRSFCQTRYIPFMGVGKKELFKDCTDSSLWKNNIFSLVWKFRKYFIVALIFISKHSLWQYKPPKFPSKFVSIVEKTTFAMRVYLVEKTKYENS